MTPLASRARWLHAVAMLARLAVVGLMSWVLGCGDDDARPMDGGSMDGSTVDGSVDAGRDGGSMDAGPDGGAGDTGAPVDAPEDVGPDAERPDVASLAEVADVFCPAIARIRCSTPTACACPRFGAIDFDECVAREISDCGVGLESRPRGFAIVAGRIATDLDALAECTAALEASYARCTGAIVDLEARCLSAFLDLDADLGDPCADSLCAGGEGVCSREDGFCDARPGRGENCDLVCAEGLVCVSGRCDDPGAVGASCATDVECASPLACAGGRCGALVALDGACTSTADCARGLRCSEGTCRLDAATTCTDDGTCAGLEKCGPELFDGRCRPQQPFDSVCESTEACAAGRCDFDVGRCTSPRSVGEPCGDSADCADGLVCGFSGSCAVPGALGESCVPGFGSSGCADGLGCIADVCRVLPSDGEPCDDVGRCASPLVCRVEPDGPRCGVARNLGDPCANAFECGDARCDLFGSATCVPALTIGEPCFADAECAAPLICSTDLVTFVSRCAPPPELGERCAGSTCPDGAYCRSEPSPRSCEPRVCDELFLFPIEEL